MDNTGDPVFLSDSPIMVFEPNSDPDIPDPCDGRLYFIAGLSLLYYTNGTRLTPFFRVRGTDHEYTAPDP